MYVNLGPLSIDLRSLGVDIESMKVDFNALRVEFKFSESISHDVDVGHLVVNFGPPAVDFNSQGILSGG